MNEPVFSMKLMKDAQKPISFIEWVILLFRPTNYSKDENCTLWFKEWNGKVYIKKIVMLKSRTEPKL